MLPTDNPKYMSFLHLPEKPSTLSYIFVADYPQRYNRSALCDNYTIHQCQTPKQKEKAFGYLMASAYTCKKPDIVVNNFPVPEQFVTKVLEACKITTAPVFVPEFSDVHNCDVYPFVTTPRPVATVFTKLYSFLCERDDNYYLTNSGLANYLLNDYNMLMTLDQYRANYRVFQSDDIYLKGRGIVNVAKLLTSLGRQDLLDRCEK